MREEFLNAKQAREHLNFFLSYSHAFVIADLQAPLEDTTWVFNLDNYPRPNKLIPCVVIGFKIFVYNLQLKQHNI